MKKIMLTLLLLFLLTACYLSYDQKTENNPHYYEDWLAENGIVDYEVEPHPTGSNIVETVYRMNGINQTCISRNTRVYYGTKEETNQLVTVFMPDNVDEPNVIVDNLVYDLDELKQAIQLYNESTVSDTFSVQGTTYITNDIILDEDQFKERNVDVLWGGLIINDVKQEIHEDEIKDFVFTNLSNPFIYRIGNLRESTSSSVTIYLGLNNNKDYVLFSQSSDHNTLKIIYTYTVDISE